MTVALMSGGRELYGWGQDRHLAADIFDALNQNTRATGNWGKKKPPTIKPFPRPSVKKPKERSGTASVKALFAKLGR